MKCCLVSNKDGDIVLLHEEKLDEAIEWIEFDSNNNEMMLVYEDGETQDFGHPIEVSMAKNIKNGTIVQVTHIVGEVIQSIQKTTFLVQEY